MREPKFTPGPTRKERGMSDDLVKRLEMKASMIELGERIEWGSDSAIMREAKGCIEALRTENEWLILGIGRAMDRLRNSLFQNAEHIQAMNCLLDALETKKDD